MEFKQTTILGFFDSSQKNYEIPVYQRAYAWDKKNWEIFLEDIVEQLNGDNSYFYGNILLETIKKDRNYEVIDGQQRLTTLTIFMRALLNVIEHRKNDSLLDDFDIEEKIRIYIKNSGNIKLRPVEYDRACFDAIIVDNKNKFEFNTPSQKKMFEAKEFFTKKLSDLSTNKVLDIFEKIEYTELTTIELTSKKDAALMFELQNNRGKDLTNMEKLKSYFMYQMYVYSNEDETNTNIENISNIFKDIYKLINDIKLDEDSILIYHNQAYIKGYPYRTLEDLKDEFKKTEDKIFWIKEYINELHTTFSNIKKFELFSSKYKSYLEHLGISAFIYPFIIKGFKFFGNDNYKLDELFKVLEIVLFRAKLINSRANIQERLNKILLGFEGDVNTLKRNIKNKLNESWYWGDENTENHFNTENMYDNNVLNYLLWRYENFLQSKGYNIKNFSIENEQIEHISPRQPNNGVIENGYDIDENSEYDEEFHTEYLNCIGNLMLISGSHNASIGNKPFNEKLNSYNKNPLLNQQAEIKSFAKEEDGKPVWKKESIDERHKKIVDFGLDTWSL
ncbi:hypothetical protein CPG37_08810 [Malaciobacter canalis]|uniref:DUF262 domain-containing protein n=1 Tax=Malaciobacter canalis TaxID=1912871 RepID=A0ABX4LTS2_9BACT|nr:DUF262 domain-containing protein [Malaciobacter canalis]PHO09591.1 hypothetical protein CPG37_08810 [Malaciobacter canalis]QEE31658.1 DUF262 and DUF1524 domain-containing protein [Malaciobacter canalis]